MNKKIMTLAVLGFMMIPKMFSQKTNWIMPQLVNGEIISKNIAFKGTNNAPQLGSNFPSGFDENNSPFQNYNSTNAAFDQNGNLLFSVFNVGERTYVFDENGGLIVLSMEYNITGASSKVFIVDLGCFKYHIISGDKVYLLDLYASKDRLIRIKEIEHYTITAGGTGHKNVSSSQIRLDMQNSKLHGYYLYEFGGNPTGNTGPSRFFQVYYYSVSSNSFSSIELLKNPTQYNENTWLGDLSGATGIMTEFAISPSGKKMAIAGNTTIYLFDINNKGKISLSKSYRFNSTSNACKLAGLEFINDQKLIYSSFDFMQSYPNSSDSVGILDFSNNSITNKTIPNSSSYARSQIELGNNGKIYLVASNGLFWVDWDKSNPTIESVNNISGFTPMFNQDIYNNSSYLGIFTLPGQSTGQQNDGIGSWNLDNTLQSMNLNGNLSYTNLNHGLTNNKEGDVYINRRIIVKNGSTVNFTNLNLFFAENAEIIIERGASLNLYGCNLESGDCTDKMWKGIRVRSDLGSTNTNDFAECNFFSNTVNNSERTTTVKDAFVAMRLVGNYTKSELNGVRFDANAKGISMRGGMNAINLNIKKATFEGRSNLKDPQSARNYFNKSYLVAPLAYSNDVWCKSTFVHIEAFNVWNIKIGHNSTGTYPVKFYGADVAIYLRRASLDLHNTEIKFTQKFMIEALSQDFRNTQNQHINIYNSSFSQTVQPNGYQKPNGVLIQDNYSQIIVHESVFENLHSYGIKVRDNKVKCDVSIKKSTFKNIGDIGVDLVGNNSLLANIKILNNNFLNHTHMLGLYVSERFSANGPTSSYNKLFIEENNFDNISRGVQLDNIKGKNPNKPLESNPIVESDKIFFDKYNDNYTVKNNTMNLVRGVGSMVGIRTNNSTRINYLENEISSKTGEKIGWMRAFASLNGEGSFVFQNTFTDIDRSMNLRGAMLESNYSCNEHIRPSCGYLLENHVLRTPRQSNDPMVVAQGFHGWADHLNLSKPAAEGNRLDKFVDVSWRHFRLNNSPLAQNKWSFSNRWPQTLNEYNAWRFKISLVNHKEQGSTTALGRQFASAAASLFRCEQGETGTTTANDNYIDTNQYELSSTNQWHVDFYKHREWTLGLLDSIQVNPDIDFVFELERLLFLEKYDSVLLNIQHYTPLSPIAKDYRDLAYIMSTTRQGDSTEIIDAVEWLVYKNPIDSAFLPTLLSIAHKDELYESPYAINARVILWDEFNIYVEEKLHDFVINKDIEGVIESACDSKPNWSLLLENNQGDFFADFAFVDSVGAFGFDSERLFFELDTALTSFYRIVAVNPFVNDTIFSPFYNLQSWTQLGHVVMNYDCARDYSIEGDIDEGCAVIGNWSVFIQSASDHPSNLVVWSDISGLFQFDGLAVYNNLGSNKNELYRIMAISPNYSDTLYSDFYNFKTLTTLFHLLNCNHPEQPLRTFNEIFEKNWEPVASVFQNSLTLHSNHVSSNIKIFDMRGKLMYTTDLESEVAIDIGTWSSGMYIIHFVNPHTNEKAIRKVIK